MNTNQDKLEILIGRSLDGELDDAQQLALDRELIRNPEMRELLEDAKAVDAEHAYVQAFEDPTCYKMVLDWEALN